MRFFSLSPSEQLLRIALAISFLYPPLAAIKDPYSWIGYFPGWLSDFVAPHQLLLLHTFGVVEVVLAIWVLFGRRVQTPALIMAVLLMAIVVTNLAQFPVLFRDIAIALAAVALAMGKRNA